MLFGRRKRLEALETQEAAGENLWTASFDQAARIKIIHAFRDVVDNLYSAAPRLYRFARGLILRDEGLFHLVASDLPEDSDLLNYVLQADDASVPTVIEAMSKTLSNRDLLNTLSVYQNLGPIFDATVNVVLREHRISFELINSEMVGIESLAMHANVVAPTLRLLAGRAEFAAVETAYSDALNEIADGKSGDAITDAGTALQEMLTALGCDGNALGPLIKSARSKGVIAAHDAPLLDSIEKTLHWVSADRSEKGDAHNSRQPSIDDAWLTVNIVGALVLRLSRSDRT